MFKKRGARIRALSVDVAILGLGLAIFDMYNKYRAGIGLTDALYAGLFWVVVLGVSYAVTSGIAACVQALEDIRDVQGGIDPDLDALLDDDISEFAGSRNADPYDDNYLDEDIDDSNDIRNNAPEQVYPSGQDIAQSYYDNELERKSRERRASASNGQARSPFAPPLSPEPTIVTPARNNYMAPDAARTESGDAPAINTIPFTTDKAHEATTFHGADSASQLEYDVPAAQYAPPQVESAAPVIKVTPPSSSVDAAPSNPSLVQAAGNPSAQEPSVQPADDNNGFPVRKGWRGRVFKMRKPEDDIDDDDDDD